MKFRKTLIFAVIFLALGAYVYFVELERARKEAQKELLVRFDKDQVEEVLLTYPDRKIRLKKNTAGQWTITEPLKTEADETTVENLVNAIARCEVEKVLQDPPENLAPYGLDEPSVTIQVKLKDDQEVPPIFVGKTTPVGFRTYVRKGEEKKIFLTSSSFYYGMNKELKDLRNKKIIDFKDEEVRKVELLARDRTIVLVKDEDRWKIERPAEYQADSSEVQSLLSSLRSIRAQDFIDEAEDLKAYGLTPPTLKVTVYLGKDEAKKTILLGGETSETNGGKRRYLKREEKDTVYLVGDWILHDLNKSVNDLRDKTLLAFDQKKASKIEVQRQDGGSFTLVREKDGRWILAGQKEEELKKTTLEHFVEDLQELRGYEIVADNPKDLSPYGLDAPEIQLTVYGENGEKLGTVLAARHGEGEEKQSYAMLEGGSTVFALRDWIFNRMDKRAQDFLKKPEKKEEAKDKEKGS